MAVRDSAGLAALDTVRDLARRLDAAPHGRRTRLVDELAALYGWSRNKVYSELRRVGWRSGRKPRADRGQTTQDMAALTHLSSTLRIGLRANGKATMETPNARSLLGVNGREYSVSNSRINTLLRRHQMDLASQRRERPVQRQRSLHPNHVHQVDPSLCVLFYLKDGSQHLMDEDAFYKNKPGNVARVADFKVWRYVLVDHYTNTIIVRYYQAAGETTANLFDFLLYAWGRIEGRPFHGVPRILVWDKGSANASGAIKCALQALAVTQIPHEAGNPRAKGSVENANDRVEKLFESRLRYEPVADVAELNRAAEAWANAYNADRIPDYDARLRRPGMRAPICRYGLWQTIREEHLRILPDPEVCQYLLSAEPVERKVKTDLTVSFRHPNTKRSERYSVAHIDQAYAGAVVRVSPLIYGGERVLVHAEDYLGAEHVHVCDPIAYDEVGGFALDAAVIGEEHKRQPDTEIERRAKSADQAAYGELPEKEIKRAKAKGETPFGGLDAHSHLAGVEAPAYMRRPGTELHVPDRARPELKPLSITAAARSLVALLSRPLTRDENRWLRERFPDGVPHDAVENLAAELRGGAPGQTADPPLKAVK